MPTGSLTQLSALSMTIVRGPDGYRRGRPASFPPLAIIDLRPAMSISPAASDPACFLRIAMSVILRRKLKLVRRNQVVVPLFSAVRQEYPMIPDWQFFWPFWLHSARSGQRLQTVENGPTENRADLLPGVAGFGYVSDSLMQPAD